MGLGSWIMDDVLGFDPPAAPDTSGLNAAAQANSAIAGRQQDLAEKAYADQKAILDQYMPLFKEQITKSIQAQDLSTARSNQSWDDYMNTWRPVEQQLAQKSLEWASPSRMKSEAELAGAGVSAQFDRARTATERSLSMAGASPEKIASLGAASRLQEAQAVGGAQAEARRAVEKEGMAYTDNAARFGRNMPSTGLQAASLADAQGQQAQGTYGNLSGAVSTPTATTSAILGSAVNANSAAGSLFGSAAGVEQQANANAYNAQMGGFAALSKIGGMTGGWSALGKSLGWGSSRKIKHMKGPVNGKAASKAVRKSKAQHWSYREGEGDGNTKDRMGPTAESLAEVAPQVSDGKAVDAIALAGLHHAAIGEQGDEIENLVRKVNRIAKAVSLEQAEEA